MKNLLVLIQLIMSLLLIASILLQNRGQGLGSSFGGGGEFYASKRGLEKLLLYLTTALVVLFAVTSILNLVV